MAELVEFMGASVEGSDEDKVYTPRGAIYINPDRVNAFYDHHILTENNNIRVMEDAAEICRKLRDIPPLDDRVRMAAIEKEIFRNFGRE